MKYGKLAVSIGLSFALLAAMQGLGVSLFTADVVQAQERRYNFKSGNWSKRVRRQQPPRRVQRREIDLFGIFKLRPPRDRARKVPPPQQVRLTPPPSQRTLLPPAARRAPRQITRVAPPPPARKVAKPKLIAPDTQVEEYVEKPKIYVYPDQQLLPLRDPRLAGAAGSPQAQAILNVLRSGAARVEVEPAARKAIIAFYKARNFAPIWLAGGGVSGKAQGVLAALANAHRHGLNTNHYRVPVVWESNGDAAAIAGNGHNLARLDVELTAMALRFARHLSGGVVDPNAISSYHDLKPPKISAPRALKKLAESGDAAGWLESLAPRHFAYGLMKLELARLGNAPEEELLPPIPTGRLIRPGMRDDRLALIRQHLAKLGFLPAGGAGDNAGPSANDPARAEPTAGQSEDAAVLNVSLEEAGNGAAAGGGDPLMYDAALVEAVKAFQRKAGMKPDGLIGKGTIRALNRRNSRNTKGARIARLKLNMERLRWMPRDFGNPHYLVNVPAFMVYLYQDGKVRWSSRVVVGKPKNQTYFFSDRIRYVEFNPYWGVPQSIIRKEFIPKLIKNPRWLDQEGYEVRDRKGRVVSSASVDWAKWRNAKHIPFDVRQLPGDKNALGRLKVMFPNKHAIYLHDTPFKSLFKRSRRAFSHGCVRVQKPRELAELVSGLDAYEIEEILKAGKNKQVRLKKTIPVHLTYFTAWPDDQGRMHYYGDVYGRDRLLKTALGKHDAAYRRGMELAGLR